jgi:hypothetical protein
MGKRLDLHEIFGKILGTRNIYFQPPSGERMSYPCIRYNLSIIESMFANDARYLNKCCYEVIVIDEDPDSEIPDKVLALPLCGFDRFYTADDLNHWVFKLFY